MALISSSHNTKPDHPHGVFVGHLYFPFFSLKPAKLHFWVRQQNDASNQEPLTKETQCGVLNVGHSVKAHHHFLWDEPNSYFGRPKLS